MRQRLGVGRAARVRTRWLCNADVPVIPSIGIRI